MDLEDYIEQLNGHINFYKQVIYTNGIEWRFYILDKFRKERCVWEVSLGEFNNGEIIWDSKGKWKDLLKNLDDITWIEPK